MPEVIPARLSQIDLPRQVASEERANLRRRLLWLMVIRLLTATILLGASLVVGIHGTSGFTAGVLMILIVGTYSASLLFAFWAPRVKNLDWLAGAQIVWDLLLATGLVYVTGSAASAFTFLYGVAILMMAILVGPQATRASSVASMGWIPHPPDQPPDRYLLDPQEMGFALLSNVIGLSLVALLADNLSTRLRRTRIALVDLAKSAASFAQLNDDIVRSITSGLVTTDLAGLINASNPAATRMFGASAESDLLGHPIGAFLAVDRLSIGSGLATRGEITAHRVDATAFQAGYALNPLLDAAGTMTGALLSFQDLTEINALRAAAQQAERLASLGRLAAGLAHEIRNPLSSISGSVELVRESESLAPEDRRLLGIVIRETERLNDLVTTMLDVSRPRLPERRSHNLGELVAEVVHMAEQGSASVAQLQFKLEQPVIPVAVAIDPGQARQVLWNLLKNAMQASPRGATIEVHLGHCGKDEVFVEVKDPGGGIEPDQLPHVFDAFYSGRTQGTGLGLALVKQIVEAHEGRVEVVSAPAQGATFRVVLPRGDTAPNAYAQSAR